jgi:hypothetical protein
MLTRMNSIGDAGASLSRLNGWEISGIIVALLVIALGAWLAPEFIRYMKIRHM